MEGGPLVSPAEPADFALKGSPLTESVNPEAPAREPAVVELKT
jgi:hypothetical protein